MPKLFTSDRLPNYFIEVDFSDENRASGVLDRQVREAFEDGKCICFRNWTVDFDRNFFANLDLEDNRAAKKLKSILADDGSIDPGLIRHQLSKCVKDEATLAQFPVHAERVSAQVTPVVDRIFQGQVYLDRRLTWRMLETVHEDLHIDVYGEERSEFQIRLFVNLDVVPRIWHTGYTLECLLERFGHLLEDNELECLGPTALCKLLNVRVYGGLSNAGKDGQPRHTAFFYSGEVWMVDSRRVAHQIFYGRRALSLDYLATPESMADPSKYYLESVETYRELRGFKPRPAAGLAA